MESQQHIFIVWRALVVLVCNIHCKAGVHAHVIWGGDCRCLDCVHLPVQYSKMELRIIPRRSSSSSIPHEETLSTLDNNNNNNTDSSNNNSVVEQYDEAHPSSLNNTAYRSIDEEDISSVDDEDSFTCKTNSVRNGCVVTTVSYGTVLLVGQWLSFSLAASSAANSSLHLNCDIAVPAFSTLLFFVLLSLFLIPLYIRGEKWKTLQTEGLLRGKEIDTPQYSFFCGTFSLFAPVYAYCLIGLFDGAADYVNVLSSKYTTLTSITVFNALSVPSAMVLSSIFMGRRYRAIHLLGALVCIAGVAIDVLMDYDADNNKNNNRDNGNMQMEQQQQQHGEQRRRRQLDEYYQYPADETFFEYDEEAYPNKVWGDVLAILGGCLYGAIDVMAEYSARQFGGPMEFLAMIGVWGVLFSGFSAITMERDDIAELFLANGDGGGGGPEEDCSAAEKVFLLGASVFSMFFHTVGVAYFVLFSEAALLNMSLLTGNFWAVGFSIFGQGIVPDPTFYVALFLIVLGILVYESAPSPIPKDETPVIDALPTTKAEFEAFSDMQSPLPSTPLGVHSHVMI